MEETAKSRLVMRLQRLRGEYPAKDLWICVVYANIHIACGIDSEH